MAVKKITLQMIADACALSRNTVSKVFNDRGSVPEATRKLVLDKARELGYAQLQESSPAPAAPSTQGKNIALLTQHKLLSHTFGAYFITSFTDQICRAGYTMKMYEVSADEIKEKRLPPHLVLGETSGILCIELFDREYQDMITALGIPCLFVDGYARVCRSLLNCDFVSMENYAAMFVLMDRLFENGAERIGFVGDREHCNSFFERWTGYAAALLTKGIHWDDSISILDEDAENYGDAAWYIEKLKKMPVMPDAFVCANDFIAIHLMSALKKLGYRVPDDVMVTGFDGSPEASVVEPTLTTVSITSTEIGALSAGTLDMRIRYPEHPYRRISVLSTPVFGGSTDKKRS
ncbi:MAG: LacI family DNA-binding transcriptional regulator [Ruminiclostridium sp.]|nr:LacI family DNA-binding transcriptional regulator [Ruminiclostridium sp.]